MEGIKKLLGAYLICVAVVVAVWFIINTIFVDSFDVSDVWFVLDILMVTGLAVALVFNYDRKRREDNRSAGDSITRAYMETNVAFYLTAAVTIIFLHNWIAFLRTGIEADNHQAWVIWAFVDTLLPLVIGVTGCAMWKSTSD